MESKGTHARHVMSCHVMVQWKIMTLLKRTILSTESIFVHSSYIKRKDYLSTKDKRLGPKCVY